MRWLFGEINFCPKKEKLTPFTPPNFLHTHDHIMPSGGMSAVHQISASGGADSMLTEDPETTSWAHVSMRHTRFAMDASSVSLTGSTKCGGNTKTQIPREGDLMTSLYVVIDLPGIINGSYKDRVGQMLVDKCSINIGNQCIDEVTSDYLFMWDCLSGQAGKSLDEMIGCDGDCKNPKGDLKDKFAKRLYVPIPVWFNSAIPGGVTGNALQLISLQFHAVSVNLNIKSILDCVEKEFEGATVKVLSKQSISTIGKAKDDDITTEGAALSNDDTNVGLEVGFVYLDSAERQRFADANMEILVRQLQTMTKKTSKNSSESHRLYFNHPVSELLFAARKDPSKPFDLSGRTIGAAKMDPIASVQLKFNNHTRLNNVGNGSAVPAEYFRTVQPFQHHSRIPDASQGEFVYSYSFALHPEEVQPSGSCNFSRIDNCVLDLQYDLEQDQEYETIVLATNWNILRINNGMAGIAYSN